MTRAIQSPMRPSAAAAASSGRRARFGADAAAPAENLGEPDFERIERSAEFVVLRRRVRRFTFAMSAVFFLWYMTYVLLSAYFRDFMSRKVFGEVNVGILFGLLEFASTVAITLAYSRFARKAIDPGVDQIREKAGVGKA